MMKHRIIPEKVGYSEKEFEQLLENAVNAYNETGREITDKVIAAAKLIRTETLAENGEEVSVYEKTLISIGFLLGSFQVRSMTGQILDKAATMKKIGFAPDEVILGMLVNQLVDNIMMDEHDCENCESKNECKKGSCGEEEKPEDED